MPQDPGNTEGALPFQRAGTAAPTLPDQAQVVLWDTRQEMGKEQSHGLAPDSAGLWLAWLLFNPKSL